MERASTASTGKGMERLLHNLEPGLGAPRAQGRPRGEPRTLGRPWNLVHLDWPVSLVGH